MGMHDIIGMTPKMKAGSFIWAGLSCIIMVLRPGGAHSKSILHSLDVLSQLLATNSSKSRSGNINIISSTNIDDSDPIALCYLPFLYPFTIGGKPSDVNGQYGILAAISLALEHLNTGNGSIVSDVAGINETCPLRFMTAAFDTQAKQNVGVDLVIKLTDRGEKEQLLPCAIVGAFRSAVSIPTSTISSIRGIPQISPASTSSSLDDKEQFELFGRTKPGDDGIAIPLLDKLTSWNVNNIAVLYVNDAYGTAYADGIRLAAQQRDNPYIRVELVDIPNNPTDVEIADAIKQLKGTEFTYFFAIMHAGNRTDDKIGNENHDRIMIEASKQGIAGTTQHTWLFSAQLDNSLAGRKFSLDDPYESRLAEAYRGVGVLRAVGGLKGIEKFDMLNSSMQQLAQSETDLSFLNSLLQMEHALTTQILGQELKFFLKDPHTATAFAFDAVIAIGLAACGLVQNANDNKILMGEEPNQASLNITGKDLYDAFLKTTFEGTSGNITIDPNTGTRDPQTTLYTLTNFIFDEAISATSAAVSHQDKSVSANMVRFKKIQTALFKSGKWENNIAYTFNDGTTNIPSDLPMPEIDANYLSTGFRIIGFVLCGIIVVMALSSSAWTYLNSKKGVVRASQPIFLHIISAGTLLMGKRCAIRIMNCIGSTSFASRDTAFH